MNEKWKGWKIPSEKMKKLNVTSLFMIYNCCLTLFSLLCVFYDKNKSRRKFYFLSFMQIFSPSIFTYARREKRVHEYSREPPKRKLSTAKCITAVDMVKMCGRKRISREFWVLLKSANFFKFNGFIKFKILFKIFQEIFDINFLKTIKLNFLVNFSFPTNNCIW
jgi:hypothetical protein